MSAACDSIATCWERVGYYEAPYDHAHCLLCSQRVDCTFEPDADYTDEGRVIDCTTLTAAPQSGGIVENGTDVLCSACKDIVAASDAGASFEEIVR